MQIDITSYTLLYSLYSWPNVVLSVFGGFLLDRVFGVRLGAIIFSILVCAGQLVFALGAYFNSFITMLAGRFIFGYELGDREVFAEMVLHPFVCTP